MHSYHGIRTSMPMPLSLPWTDIALRLALTVAVGLMLGYNRGEHGKAAGMRTTLLVCLAASVAMMQVNVLLPLAGRTPDSFVMNDLMRLPLGILTGVGFIGGGAILRRGNLVVGVTTAATLWLGTVIGLCIGGGQIALGLAATVLGLFALWALKWVESALRQEAYARFSIETDGTGPTEPELRRRIDHAGLSIVRCEITVDRARDHQTLVFGLRETRLVSDTRPPLLVAELASETGIVRLHWAAPAPI
jgi:putative Mg2+ transporter-C (MgtC) family protein